MLMHMLGSAAVIGFMMAACDQADKNPSPSNTSPSDAVADVIDVPAVENPNEIDQPILVNSLDDAEVSCKGFAGPWDNIDCYDAPSIGSKVFSSDVDSIVFGPAVSSSPGSASGIAVLTLGDQTIEINFHQHGRCVALGNYDGVSWSGLDGQNWIEPNRYFFVSDDGASVIDNHTGVTWTP